MRLLRPSLFVFCVALIASLCIHLPVYEVLGVLAEQLLRTEAPPEQKLVQLELAPLASTEAEPKVEPVPAVPEKPEDKPEPEPPKPKPEPKAEVKPEVEPVLAKPELVQPVPAQPVIPEDNPLAVTQRSDDPNVEAPENPKYIAEDNRRVEQETVASIRNMVRDDEQPEASARPSDAAEKAEAGDAEETAVEDLQDVQGSEERTATEREATVKPETPSQPSAGTREAEALSRAQAEPQEATAQQAPARASGAPSGGQEEKLIVHDAAGSFVIHKRPEGRGKGDDGGALQPGTPSAERQTRASSQRRTGSQPDLRMSWSQFEDTFGSDELREQREQYIAQRRSKVQGENRREMWKKFRAAIENFVPNVQPGNQTALNTAASPFAAYLAAVHRRIHREYAFGFLRNLPIAGGPYDDPTLNTTLEIVINGDGSLHKVGVAKTSGFLLFDQGAFESVMRGAPYPVPPRKILSGDGRVYVHWGFYRNERQCGTFNARPYILPNPPGTPAPGGPLRDSPDEPSPASPPYQPHEGELGWLDSGDHHGHE